MAVNFDFYLADYEFDKLAEIKRKEEMKEPGVGDLTYNEFAKQLLVEYMETLG